MTIEQLDKVRAAYRNRYEKLRYEAEMAPDAEAYEKVIVKLAAANTVLKQAEELYLYGDSEQASEARVS